VLWPGCGWGVRGVAPAFATTAVLLALVGLYGASGVMVGLRQREFGVRLALGSGARRVRRMVLGQGLLAAWLAASSLRPLVVELDPRDPATFAGAAVLLALAAVAACLSPAWLAARVDPVVTLRAE
jgi:putative ABC transport system permease protein